MKHSLLLIACLLTLSPCGSAAEPATPASKPIAFDTHDGYFVSNKFETTAPTSFVVLKDQASFDKVFGVGMVMNDKHHRLQPATFGTKIVLAAIHRGKAMVTYQVTSVTAEAQTLVLRYTTASKPSESAEFACPLIISLDKGDYSKVRFVENGKKIKLVDMEPPAAPKDATKAAAEPKL